MIRHPFFYPVLGAQSPQQWLKEVRHFGLKAAVVAQPLFSRLATSTHEAYIKYAAAFDILLLLIQIVI